MFSQIQIILHIKEHICTFSSQIFLESFICVCFLWLFIGLGYSSSDLLTQLCHKCSFWASLFFFLFSFLIGRKLFCNVLLVSAAKQHKPAKIIHLSPPSWASSPPPIPPLWVITEHQAGLPVLQSTFPSHQLPLLHMLVYICQWCFLYSSLFLSPTVSRSPFSISASLFLP